MVNIKRNIKIYSLVILLTMFFFNFIFAYGEGIKVYDDAGLYTDEEIAELDYEANLISEEFNMDIIIVTTSSANGKTSREYADDYYDENDFGFGSKKDGILFLMDMDNGEAYISTSGQGIRYLTDQRIESILDLAFEKGLEDGDYYGGTQGFLSGTKKYLKSGIPADQYSEDESVKKENSLTLLEGIISVFSGGLVSGAFFFGVKSKYKMKNPKKPVTFRDNSIISLSASEDRLIDTVLTHRRIPKSTTSDSGKSTTHTSSSGNTHGGGGRKL